MTVVPGEAPVLGRSGFGPGGRLLLALSRQLAIAGGLVFVALVLMSIVSIVGRKVFAWPVPGDVELLQMCAAFAASAFFAHCHLGNGDVKVDFFTHNLAPRKVALGQDRSRPRFSVTIPSSPIRRPDRPMTEKKFASQADLVEKKISFDKLSDHAYAYTAEGDPNTGVIVGDDAVMVIDTQATPVMAQDVIRRIREVTDKPIRYVLLSHYHAVRVLGASGYQPEHIIASRDTYDLIVERGEADMKSEIERFPRLFQAVESVPGLTWPTLVFERRMTLWLGKLQVEIMQLGRGHTKGDTVAWLPQEKILFSGDLVEYDATPYTGDAYLTDWPATLDALAALGPEKLVPGRGASLQTPAQVKAGLDGTRAFVSEMFAAVKRGAASGKDLKSVYKETYALLKPKFGHWVIFDHCLPFDVTRAYDEATQYRDPRIWTAQRDKEMWEALEG